MIALALLGSATAFLGQCRRVLRQVRSWQRESSFAAVCGTQLALVLSVVIVALPLLLGIFLPRHPAL